VFVVGYRGDWRPPVAVLFEPHSLSGYPPPRRTTGETVAPTISSRPSVGGGLGTDFDCDGGLIALSVGTAHHNDPTGDNYVTHSLRGEGFDASEDGTGRGTPLVAIDLQQVTSRVNRSTPTPESPPLTTAGTIVFGWQNSEHQGDSASEKVTPSLDRSKTPAVLSSAAVRRLTPRECERLQGFPDHYTLVPYRGHPAKDGPRYKALGNSMAVPVMRWIGERMAGVASCAITVSVIT
jgi:DNA (cytosine-5)-methyltransferase 1